MLRIHQKNLAVYKYTLGLLGSLLFTITLPVHSSNWQTTIYLRERITHLSAVEFDSDRSEAGSFWTQRFTAETHYHLDDNWSFSGGILSALQEGVDESPVERNNLDVHIAAVHYKTDVTHTILGRQVLKLGSQRLIGWRDGTNVRRAWQGLRTQWQMTHQWQSDWFALEAIGVKPNGIFNDDAQHENRLIGSYHTLDLTKSAFASVKKLGLDLYYLYANRDDRNTVEGSANQIRHSLGWRYFAEGDRWYWDWEGIVQAGRHGENKIKAWTLATKTGYKFDTSISSTIMASINIASGDERSGDGELNTFDALFPRGDYFSGAAILGPANFYNAHIYYSFNPSENISVTLDTNVYWRLEEQDGIYGPPGNLFVRPGNSDSNNVNWSYSTSIEWGINNNLDSVFLFTYSKPREFLRESGANDNTLFIEFTLNWRLN